MTQHPWLSDLAERVLEHHQSRRKPEQRLLVALAGPPAAGKSTVADWLVDSVNERRGNNQAVVLPMDGFHFDNAILDELDIRARKGAPHTFDVDGFAVLLDRLVGEGSEALVPVFDRGLDLARNAARRIDASHDIVVVEGNYLLLDAPKWENLSTFFDLTIFLEVPPHTLRERLIQRWLDHGHTESEAIERARSNDLPNAEQVMGNRKSADIVVKTDKNDAITLY